MPEITIGSEKNVNSTSNATPLNSEDGLVFNRRDFLKVGGTNQEISPTGIESADFSNESVNLGEDTQASYTNFMTNHFENLIRLKQQGKVGVDTSGADITFDAMFGDGTSHAYEAKILSIITSDDGKTVDKQKLHSFLKTSKGMMISTQLLEDVTAQKLFALGLSAANNPKGERSQGRPEIKIKLGIDQGRLNKVLSRFPGLEEAYHSGALKLSFLAGSALAGSFLNNVISAGEPTFGLQAGVFGAAAGGVAALIGGLAGKTADSIGRDGLTLNLERSIEGIKLMQSNPQEAVYMKAITGIDVNDFKVDGNLIEYKNPKDRFAESTGDMDNVRAEILQGIYARNNFFEDLGIDPTKQDAIAEQRLIRGRSGSTSSEQLGAHWQEMIESEFKTNTYGIRDVNGNIPGHPNFDPKNLDVKGNLQRYTEARRKVIGKMTEEFIAEKKDQEHKNLEVKQEKRFAQQVVEATGNIDAKIENLKKDETKQQREATLNAEAGTLSNRNTEIDQKLQELQGSDEKGKKKREIAIELKTRFKLDIFDIKDIQDEIDRINTELEKVGGLYESLATKEKEVTDLAQQMLKDALDELKGLPVNVQQRALLPDYANLLLRAERQTPEYEKIKRQIKAETEKTDKLKEAFSEYQNAEVDIAKSNNEKLGSILPQIAGQEQSFDSLTNPAKVGSPIPEADISTVSIADLTDKALTLTDISGSPLFTDRNTASQAVIKAKTEALVRTKIPTFGAYQSFMSELSTNGIVDFEMKTVTEMTDRAEKPISAGGLGWNPADRTANEQHITNVLKAYQELNDPTTKVTRYRTSLELEKQYIQGRIQKIDSEKVQIGNTIQEEITRLEAYKVAMPKIKDVSDSQGEIFSEAREALTERLDDYIGRDKVVPGDTKYTPAEQATGAEKGYYEMLDLIFKYKSSPNREQVYADLNKIVPPAKLADMLQRYLIMLAPGVGPGPTTKDLPHIFTYIQNKRKGFTPGDYRRAMGSIINDLRQEALAFTKI